MTGLPGREVLAEIIGSSLVLREAGDYLDMLLTSHILDRAGIDREDPAGRGLTRRLRLRQRATKEALFAEGVVRVEIGDDTRTVTLEEFLTDPRVQSFVQRLRSKFQETLEIAVECAREHPQPDGQGTTPVEISYYWGWPRSAYGQRDRNNSSHAMAFSRYGARAPHWSD